jgi:hypothetical protein
VNEKRKLISRFGWDCFWISLIFAATILTSVPMLLLFLSFYSTTRDKQWKEEIKWRKPTLIEFTEFLIFIAAISACMIAFEASGEQLLKNQGFLISLWILALSIYFHRLAKDLAALNSSKPAPN